MHGSAVLYQVNRNGKTYNGLVRKQHFCKLYKYTCMYTCILTAPNITQPPVSAGQEEKTIFPVQHIHHLHPRCPQACYEHKRCPAVISATTEVNAATSGAEENNHSVAHSKYLKGQESNNKTKTECCI